MTFFLYHNIFTKEDILKNAGNNIEPHWPHKGELMTELYSCLNCSFYCCLIWVVYMNDLWKKSRFWCSFPQIYICVHFNCNVTFVRPLMNNGHRNIMLRWISQWGMWILTVLHDGDLLRLSRVCYIDLPWRWEAENTQSSMHQTAMETYFFPAWPASISSESRQTPSGLPFQPLLWHKSDRSIIKIDWRKSGKSLSTFATSEDLHSLHVI